MSLGMDSSLVEPARPCHIKAMAVLAMANAEFLEATNCFFGGGTRIAMELGEYRDSHDVDFMCSDPDGWRTLRAQVSNRSLGSLFRQAPELVREVRADRYGIRTFALVDGDPVKIEIVREGHIPLQGEKVPNLPVLAVSRASSVAQKLLANADRGIDKASECKDLIDLAFMASSWSQDILAKGLEWAESAYGAAVRQGLAASLRLVEVDSAHWRRCLSNLAVSSADERLCSGLAGLRRISEVQPPVVAPPSPSQVGG